MLFLIFQAHYLYLFSPTQEICDYIKPRINVTVTLNGNCNKNFFIAFAYKKDDSDLEASQALI